MVAVLRCQWGRSYTYRRTHRQMLVSLCVCVCVCVAECKRQYVARYKTTYRPQSEAHIYTHTHIHSHTQTLTTLTYLHTHGSSQNAQAKIAANYMRLQSSAATEHFSLSYSFRRRRCCYCCCYYCLFAAFAARAQHNCFYVASFQLHSLSVPFWARVSQCILSPFRLVLYTRRCFVLLPLLLRRPAALKSRPTHPVSSRDKTLTTTTTAAQYHRLLYTALVPKSFYFSITFCFLFACSRCKP